MFLVEGEKRKKSSARFLIFFCDCLVSLVINARESLIGGTAALGPVESTGEEFLHGGVVKDDAAQDSGVPQVVAAANVVEAAGEPALGDLAGVDDGAAKVDEQGLCDGGVKVVDKLGSVGKVELQDGHEARQGEADEEADAGPGHVGAVELGVPRQDDAGDAEHGGEAHVGPAADGVAVKRRVLGGHDGGGDEQRDAGVVDAGKHGHGLDVGDGAHGVPDGGAHQRQAGHHEEDGGHDHVRLGAEVEVGAAGVKVKGHGQHQDQAQGVRPDVDELVGHVEDGLDALDLGLAEAVASLDVGVVSPWRGQFVV